MHSTKTFRQASFAGLIVLFLSGCAGVAQKDGAPANPRDVSDIPDAIPVVHQGAIKNSPYQHDGVLYEPMMSANEYSEVGIASWYGTKFHGKQTANGEVYDLYGMTAAHKTLPLPSYVKVTNRANDRSVVLRVNDRGPFVEDRVIDLSFAAAKKLGFAEDGITEVLVEGIDVGAFAAAHIEGEHQEVFLQMAAFSNYHNAQVMRRQLSASTDTPVKIVKSENEEELLYKVRIGPVQTPEHMEALLDTLEAGRFDSPYLVYETVAQ
ncbi:septal ring lytic transglycosylase RlpA family protein [Endozoicomonas montiporae]|uniref:Endolytic peptidoglycan transglycosylase RlpA n=1 Tax=Endozoicomonas montiporae CL-33 TaxID=570277 RepID=A0A142B8S0_9GAMM|nr:septal ring lytic transglycosylase RlpA family protein [Endozoicomonas montiporae]AMO55146.1 rare lipoprotein A [Endozoicomonas montiporae CL-33]